MDTTAWTEMRQALADMDFPAGKEQLVAGAERRGAGPRVLRLLRALPLGTYRNIAEIRSSVPLDPAADEGQTAQLKARQARSPHDKRIAEHLRRVDG